MVCFDEDSDLQKQGYIHPELSYPWRWQSTSRYSPTECPGQSRSHDCTVKHDALVG